MSRRGNHRRIEAHQYRGIRILIRVKAVKSRKVFGRPVHVACLAAVIDVKGIDSKFLKARQIISSSIYFVEAGIYS